MNCLSFLKVVSKLTIVVLSLQLPFAVWPLVYFTSSKRCEKNSNHSIMRPPLLDGSFHDQIPSSSPLRTSIGLLHRSSFTNTSDSEITADSFQLIGLKDAIAEEDDAQIVNDTDQFDDQLLNKTYENSARVVVLSVGAAILITVFNLILFIQLIKGEG